ncbi:MAG: KOW motif-containing protein [Bacilli bacterium]|nr:KOW motif-containing protein [Bacilli bacterium]
MAQEGQKHWYIINTYSQRERRAAENLERTKIAYHLEDNLFEIIVAEETVMVETVNRKTKQIELKPKQKNLYPGHLFVQAIMTHDLWYKLRNCIDVTGIAGSAGGGQLPTPVSDEEMESVLKRIGRATEDMYSRYNIGDRVKIINGPFEGQEGEISDIKKNYNEEGQIESCSVVIQAVIFGRKRDLEVDFAEIDML